MLKDRECFPKFTACTSPSNGNSCLVTQGHSLAGCRFLMLQRLRHVCWLRTFINASLLSELERHHQWGSPSASDPQAKNTGQRATKGTVLTSQSLSPWCNCRRLGGTLASWCWQDINVGNPLWRRALLWWWHGVTHEIDKYEHNVWWWGRLKISCCLGGGANNHRRSIHIWG